MSKREASTPKTNEPNTLPTRNSQSSARIRGAIIGVLILAVGTGIYLSGTSKARAAISGSPASSTAPAGHYQYAIGTPGIGTEAPAFSLPTTAGENFTLTNEHGKAVLLYFQEGVGCQPCWEQIKAIEAQWAAFQRAGIDQLVSVTVDPLGALKRKVQLENLKTPLLSDANLAVSHLYETNRYGMMGEHYDGHSFILVGPDGRIRWRADYGGAPDYTMFVPVADLLADLKRDTLKAAGP